MSNCKTITRDGGRRSNSMLLVAERWIWTSGILSSQHLAGHPTATHDSGNSLILEGLGTVAGYRTPDGQFCLRPPWSHCYNESRHFSGSCVFADPSLACRKDLAKRVYRSPRIIPGTSASTWSHSSRHLAAIRQGEAKEKKTITTIQDWVMFDLSVY